jgi:hypothetical protein
LEQLPNLANVVLIVLTALGLYASSAAKFFTIREHTSYAYLMQREIDSMLDRIKVIEQTRPTTGELEARFQQFKKNGE